jgi:RNA polymerase sigma-70 factor (ECF subfamily)
MSNNSTSSQQQKSEAALISQLIKNDDSAFEQLVRLYSPKMLTIAQRFFNEPDDAKECLQLSFIQVFEKIASFRHEASLPTWLHRITVNTALMMLRKQKRHQHLPFDCIEDFTQHYNSHGERTLYADNSGNTLESLFELKELTDDLKKIIHSLPEKYCNVLLLRDIQELSTRETAEILAISQAAVKTQLHRARLFLKAILTHKNSSE